jgi:hypothetical protein
VELRQAVLWSGLLLGGQATDTLTTAVDRARGAVEAMPLSAQMMDVGGVVLFWCFKLMVVAGAATALVAAARKVTEHDHRLARLTFRVSLVAVQAATVCLAYVSISNLVLMTSIQ